MIFTPTELTEAYIIDIDRHEDERGFFARSWCAEEFASHGLDPGLVQCSISFNRKKGTLRGMHYQAPPHAEDKVVRCTAGAIYDVIVDLRPDSDTYKRWLAFELSAANRRAIYVPQGFAHGFQTLEDDTEVLYQMSQCYHPESARGIRWNDPAIGIKWPVSNPVISERDQSLALAGKVEKT